MKFNTQFSYKNDNPGYQNRKPSSAIPGQAYSISQVVQRLRAGLPVSVIKSGYNPDGFPKYDDLTDIDQFKKVVQEKSHQINDKIKAAKDAKDAISEAKKADDK